VPQPLESTALRFNNTDQEIAARGLTRRDFNQK
jgi:hypothetical protein